MREAVNYAGFESGEARRNFEKMLKRSSETLADKKRILDKRLGRQLGGGRHKS